MKIMPIMVTVLVILMIPMADAVSLNSKQPTTQNKITTKDSAPASAIAANHHINHGGGGSCLTKIGTDGQKMDLMWKPRLVYKTFQGNLKSRLYKGYVILHDRRAPEGKMWIGMIVDGEFCLAWNPETKRKIPYESSQISVTEQDNTVLPAMWWHPRNRHLW